MNRATKLDKNNNKNGCIQIYLSLSKKEVGNVDLGKIALMKLVTPQVDNDEDEYESESEKEEDL